VLMARICDRSTTEHTILVALGPDLIVAAGTGQASLPALTTTIPIISYFGPSATTTYLSVLVGSVARPMGNWTGVFSETVPLTGKHCDIALELVPGAVRIGVLVDTSSSGPRSEQ
jgi:ABC-type uncharacterized transport system substrate-binding protein